MCWLTFRAFSPSSEQRQKCMVVSLPMPDCHTFCLLFSCFSNEYHSVYVWSTALKLGYVNTFDTLFLVMGFISLVDEIQFRLISNLHICIRFINFTKFLYCISIVQQIPLKPSQWVSCPLCSSADPTLPSTRLSLSQILVMTIHQG